MQQEPTPEIIYQSVAIEFGISAEDICARQQRRSTRIVAEARQITAYLLRLHTEMPMRIITTTLGFDDKQFVSYCVKRTINALATSPQYRLQVARIELKIWEGMVGVT